jgi:hypothetical protein
MSRFVCWKIEEELRSKAARGCGSAFIERTRGFKGVRRVRGAVGGIGRGACSDFDGRRAPSLPVCSDRLDIVRHKAGIHVGF